MASDVSAMGGTPIVVLIVEDEALIQELVRLTLEEAGFAVQTASDGDLAMAMFKEGDAALVRAVVTDVDLGSKVDGWAVAKRARELSPSIPIVYISGGAGSTEWSANGVPNSVLITSCCCEHNLLLLFPSY